MDTAQIPDPQQPSVAVPPVVEPGTPVVVVQPPQGRGMKFFIIVGICLFMGIGASVLLFQAYNTTESRTKANLDTTIINTPGEYVVPPVRKNNSSNEALENDLKALDVNLDEVDTHDQSLDQIDPDAALDDEAKI